MNEQKDKLLINLVEPGRIGRCPFNKEKFISQFSLRMGIVIEFPLLTGLAALMEIGWLVWLSLICGLRAAAGRTAPQREDKPTKTNQLTRPFSLFSI